MEIIQACALIHSIVSDSLWPCGPQPTRVLCSWDSTGKNTGVGCHVLFQGIEPRFPALQADYLISKPTSNIALRVSCLSVRYVYLSNKQTSKLYLHDFLKIKQESQNCIKFGSNALHMAFGHRASVLRKEWDKHSREVPLGKPHQQL